jgi:MFS family permease
MSAVSLPAGLLSDRLGPKQVATVGLAVAGASNVGLAYAQHLLLLLGLKVLGGAGAGLAFIAGVRYVTVVFAPARLHFTQGLYGGWSSSGRGPRSP